MAYYEGEISPMCWGGNNNGSFGNGWEGLIGLALVAGLFDNGNGGLFGNRGGNNGNCSVAGLATQADLSAGFNNSAVLSNLNDIILGQAQMQNFINQGFAGVNQSVTSGVSSLQQTLCQGFNGVNASITDVGYSIKDCCCQTQRAIDGVNYNISTQFGALNNTLCGLGRDIIDNQNANYRALHEEIVANKIEAKNERIAELQAQVSGLQLKASQEAQNAYLLSELKPCGRPAYIVPNPNCCYNYGVYPTGSCGFGASVQ